MDLSDLFSSHDDWRMSLGLPGLALYDHHMVKSGKTLSYQQARQVLLGAFGTFTPGTSQSIGRENPRPTHLQKKLEEIRGLSQNAG